MQVLSKIICIATLGSILLVLPAYSSKLQGYAGIECVFIEAGGLIDESQGHLLSLKTLVSSRLPKRLSKIREA